MLEKLVKKEYIQINVDASSWEEAITIAAAPLVQNGSIKASYVEGILESTREVGPYFVLLPHVALPHTRPEKGAIEDAIGICVLNEPVVSGNKANDPVKYLFTLSATSDDKHLSALATIADLFESDDFFRLLDNARDVDEIYAYIKKL